MQRTLALALALALSSTTIFGCGHHGANADADVGAAEDTGSSSAHDVGTGNLGVDSGEDAASDAFMFADDTGGGGSDDGGNGSGDGGGSTIDANVGTPLPLGSPCTVDEACGSGRCAATSPSSGMICVVACSSHADCTGAGTYCAPRPDGEGVCATLPSSLCSDCTADSDCGVLSEFCAAGAGDPAPTCHTDCSLDSSACPTGYTCTALTTTGSAPHRVCSATGGCAAALGCTSSDMCSPTQSCCSNTCTPIDTATSCGGCGIHCGTDEGCCGLSCRPLNTILNCMGCGVACLGGGTTGDASCSTTTGCRLTCRGENFDANGDAADGCETLDSVPPGHTQAAATSRGSFQCSDTISADSFSGHIVSDQRLHLPSVSGLDVVSGSAPDFWSVVATGDPGMDTCVNDLSATITTTGGSPSGTCYRLSITAGSSTYTANVSGAGTATITQGAGAYAAGATLTFHIEKTCSSATHENVAYTVSYHL